MSRIERGEVKLSPERVLTICEVLEVDIATILGEYLLRGCYPFTSKDESAYYDQLSTIIDLVLEIDVPMFYRVSHTYSHKIKRLLKAIASNVPFTPNISKLARDLDISDRRTLLGYLDILSKARLINLLNRKAIGSQIYRKPDKIFLNNSNLMYALTP